MPNIDFKEYGKYMYVQEQPLHLGSHAQKKQLMEGQSWDTKELCLRVDRFCQQSIDKDDDCYYLLSSDYSSTAVSSLHRSGDRQSHHSPLKEPLLIWFYRSGSWNTGKKNFSRTQMGSGNSRLSCLPSCRQDVPLVHLLYHLYNLPQWSALIHF